MKVKSPVKGVGSPRRPGRPAKDTSPTTKVNHPRFQGQSDHEVRIRRQEKAPLVGSPGLGEYRCDSCAFHTSRLNLMVIHKKQHLSSPSTVTTQQKAAQKRPNSPTKKTNSKRSKKTTEPDDGDLFDQVKRNLEAKEVVSNPSPQPRTKKTNSSPKTPKTPKLPRTPRTAKSPGPAAAVKTPTVKTSDTKTQFNPKKKWLKSLQKEANPEVKNKLMADWEEDEEEGKQEETQQHVETTAPVENNKEAPVESDSDHEHRPSKSDLLHQRSDDEDDDETMETDITNPKSPDKFQKEEQETTSTEESLAGISAEIDKLNADLDATNHETRSSKINGEPEPVSSLLATKESDPTVVNGVKTSTYNPPPKCDDEIKQDVASLLAETSVPVLPDITELGKVNEEMIQKCDSPVEEMHHGEEEEEEEKKMEVTVEAPVVKEVGVVTENDGGTLLMENGAVTVTENGVETEMETTNGGSNILMQVEGGETYMVVWEPGSNIQEFLTCGGEGEDGSAGATRTLLIDPSSLQAGSDLENLFQMAVAASAAPPPQNEQSNPT